MDSKKLLCFLRQNLFHPSQVHSLVRLAVSYNHNILLLVVPLGAEESIPVYFVYF